MAWENYKGQNFPQATTASIKRRYSVIADFLAFQQCPIQYGAFKVRKYEPARQVQLFFGIIVHEVLDRAHAHYKGLIDPTTKGTIPTSNEIREFYIDVENSLIARKINAIKNLRRHALKVCQRFNWLEGKNLYHRVKDSECKLQADKQSYILHGVVDVLVHDLADPAAVEIWDYKASRRPGKGTPLFERHVFQMNVYAELYRQKTGNLPSSGVLYYLGHLGGQHPPPKAPSNAKMTVKFTKKGIRDGMAAFDKIVQEIETCHQQKLWPNPASSPPDGTCPACDLRWKCRAASKKFRMIYP